MRGRPQSWLCDGFAPPLFGEVSTEARTRVGVDLSRVSAGPACSGEGVRPRAARLRVLIIVDRPHAAKKHDTQLLA